MDQDKAAEMLQRLSEIGILWALNGEQIRATYGEDSVEFFVIVQMCQSLGLVIAILSGQEKYSRLVSAMKAAVAEDTRRHGRPQHGSQPPQRPYPGQSFPSLN